MDAHLHAILQHGFNTRHDLFHVGRHVSTNSVAVVVEEIKPRHDAVFGMEPFHHLFGHLLDVSNQRIVGRFRDFVRVDGAF